MEKEDFLPEPLPHLDLIANSSSLLHLLICRQQLSHSMDPRMPSNAQIGPRCRSHGIQQLSLVPCAATYNLDGTMPGSRQIVGYIRFEYHFITILYSVYLGETKMVNRINWENQDGQRLTFFYGISRHHQNGADHTPLSNGSQFS